MENNPIKNRKDEHIEIVSSNHGKNKQTTWLENVKFVHKALPDINFEDIEIRSHFFKKSIDYPILINAITGGTELGMKINKQLGNFAKENNIPMMVGSQRIALEHSESMKSFSIIREISKEIPLISNLGIEQITSENSLEMAEKSIKMIEADAFAIHLNLLQEIIQPEGGFNLIKSFDKIKELKNSIGIPVIIKEVGSGISYELATKLFKLGIDGIDTAGLGGTNWTRIESFRAEKQELHSNQYISKQFEDWGIPTAASICEVNQASIEFEDKMIIAGGGIKSGLDIAKSLRLGANLASIAQEFLVHALNDKISLQTYFENIIKELKIAMYLTDSSSLMDLSNSPIVISPPLQTWLEQRVYNQKKRYI